MIQCYNDVPFWVWTYDPMLAITMCASPSDFFDFFVGIIASSLLIFGSTMIYWGLNPLANQKEKLSDLMMGGIIVAFTTLPLIRIQMSDIVFIFGCLIPPAAVSIMLMLVGYGWSRSPAGAWKIHQSSFFICLLPCFPLWAARFVYWYSL